MKFEDNIRDNAGISITRVVRKGEDRENWRRCYRGATAGRLNDSTV